MTAHKELTIGLFGFGVVGEGLYKVLEKTPSLKAQNQKSVYQKSRRKNDMLRHHFLQPIRYELLNDPTINVIVEVIDDADAAFRNCFNCTEKRERCGKCQQKNDRRTFA